MLNSTQKNYIVAFDQGTTSSRAIVFDRQANIVSVAQREFSQIYPQAGWVEHDAMEIWATQSAVWVEALAQAGIASSDVAAIGVTNQRETTVVWHKATGKPIYNAIVWQSRQSQAICQQLKAQGLEEKIKQITGLVLDPYFSASKIRWILDHVEGAQQQAEAGELLFGTIDSWLIWKLTGGKVHVTDFTNASRTMLFDIEQRVWSDELLAVFNIPKRMLPEVKSSSEIYGYSESISGQEQSIAIAGIAGDQQAALFGQLCIAQGQAKNTYGTGCFLLMNTGEQRVHSEHGLLTTLACDATGQPCYALEGAVFNAGSSIQWLRDEMKLIHDAKDSEYYAKKVPDSQGVYVVPAFTGLGAPYWDSEARGTIIGLTRGTGMAHIIRATLESIAYQVKDILDVMQQDAKQQLTSLRVDGGATQNQLLMQFQADLLGVAVERANVAESTAMGAAFLAGLAVGFWQNLDELQHLHSQYQQFVPQAETAQMQKYYQGWQKAVKRSQHWAQQD